MPVLMPTDASTPKTSALNAIEVRFLFMRFPLPDAKRWQTPGIKRFVTSQ
jgi:hypothetical protein